MTYLENLYAAREVATSSDEAMHVQYLINEYKRQTESTDDFSTPPDRRSMSAPDANPAGEN